jgi:hypothetical protein
MPLLPLWAFVACSTVNCTNLILMIIIIRIIIIIIIKEKLFLCVIKHTPMKAYEGLQISAAG